MTTINRAADDIVCPGLPKRPFFLVFFFIGLYEKPRPQTSNRKLLFHNGR